jgi:hypothetical protein
MRTDTLIPLFIARCYDLSPSWTSRPTSIGTSANRSISMDSGRAMLTLLTPAKPTLRSSGSSRSETSMSSPRRCVSFTTISIAVGRPRCPGWSKGLIGLAPQTKTARAAELEATLDTLNRIQEENEYVTVCST